MDIKQEIIEIIKIKESPINPQIMSDSDFNRLVKSLKKDKTLTSAVLLMIDGNDYMCISGHHRIKAARKAGIKKVPAIIVNKIPENDRIRLQLTHNDIHGEPDLDTVKLLEKKLLDTDIELVKFTEKSIFTNEIKYNVPEYCYVNICLLEETRDSLVQIIDKLSDNNVINYLVEKEEFNEIEDLLTEAYKKGFRTPGRAFKKFIDIVKRGI